MSYSLKYFLNGILGKTNFLRKYIRDIFELYNRTKLNLKQ